MRTTTGRRLKIAATVLGGVMVLGAGNCVPDNYWAGLLGDTLSDAVDQVMEDFISDSVDALDPALDVNQI